MVLTKIPGELIADNTIATADLADNAVTTAKIANTAVTAAKLTSGAAESGATGIKSDIALLAFKTQANGNLAKYNLVDQAVDSFEDASGVNSSASTNATRDSSGKYYSGAASAQEALTTVESSSWTAPAAIESTMHLLVVAGGGGSASQGNGNGAGGAGGLVYISNYAVTGGQAYTYTVGAGGASFTSTPSPSGQPGNAGSNSVFDGASFHQTITANGGGGGATNQTAGTAGGSGGGEANGPGWNSAIAGNQPANFGSYTGVGFGNNGGIQGNPSWPMSAAGGGGAGGVGGNSTGTNSGGAGGVGKDYSSVFGTGVGESGWFAGGGGGGGGPNPPGVGGTGGQGGGGDGGTYNSPGDGGTPGTANTGGGGGGAGADKYPSGGGGSGVIILKYNTLGNMTLVSNSTTAQAVPTKGDLVLTYTNNAGTATLNTDLIASVSRDNGTTYTAVTLTGQGTTGGQTIASASGVDISGQPSGTSMVWKVATANQSGSKKTFLNGVSLGWA